MEIVYPPSRPHFVPTQPAIFLAGSIEMGKAVNWQSQICEGLADQDVLMLNPRRSDWDSSWEQSIDNPTFVEQVEWELGMLTFSDIIVMYFHPDTMAPITLMELGLHVRDDKPLVVCCPEGYWRKGNVDIVCNRYNVPVLTQFEDIVPTIRKLLNADKPYEWD